MDFLRHIFDLLNEGGVFDVHSDEQKAIVDFKHPEELKVNIFAKITYREVFIALQINQLMTNYQ